MNAAPSRSRRWLALAAAVTAALLFVPAASAGSAAAIKGVGAGKTTLGFVQFELSAHVEDNPATPENGFGQVKIERAAFISEGVPIAALSLRIDVRCVNPAFVGLRPSARITGKITRSSEPSFVGETEIIIVSDGGEPFAAPVDSFEFGGSVSDPNTTCLIHPPVETPPNVEQGNIVVKL